MLYILASAWFRAVCILKPACVRRSTAVGRTRRRSSWTHSSPGWIQVSHSDPAKTYLDSLRQHTRAVAKAYRGKDGTLIRTLLAEAQFDPELATEIRERWVMPRRRITIPYLEQGIRDGFLRSDADPSAMIDLLYGPIYFRLQMGTGPLSDAYIDEIFDHAMKGLKKI